MRASAPKQAAAVLTDIQLFWQASLCCKFSEVKHRLERSVREILPDPGNTNNGPDNLRFRGIPPNAISICTCPPCALWAQFD